MHQKMNLGTHGAQESRKKQQLSANTDDEWVQNLGMLEVIHP